MQLIAYHRHMLIALAQDTQELLACLGIILFVITGVIACMIFSGSTRYRNGKD